MIPLLLATFACAGSPDPVASAASSADPPAPLPPSAFPADPAPEPALALAPSPSPCAASVADLGAPDDLRLHRDSVLVVTKGDRHAAQYADGALIGCWPVALAPGGGDRGPKRQRGDLKTPEGWYRTSDCPWSTYYHAITIHYPNAADAAAGVATGLIDQSTADRIVAAEKSGRIPPQNTALGGDLLLHGGGSSADWTLGCVGLEDAHIDALRAGRTFDQRGWVLILP